MSQNRPSRPRARRPTAARAHRPTAARAHRPILVLATSLMTAVSMLASGAVAGSVDGSSEAAVTGRLVISPIAISLVVSPSTVQVGETFDARATLTNIGSSTVSRISVRLRVAGGLLVPGRATQSIKHLPAGGATSLGWSVCGKAPGSYLVFAEATFSSIVIDSPTRLVLVRPGPGHCPSPGGPRHG